ncbi:MAG TPA: hypothetical protein PLO06_11460 [Methanoregulaceae archaeon]|nr:hypothetical protein [Methanoregulaceae archaeon]
MAAELKPPLTATVARTRMDQGRKIIELGNGKYYPVLANALRFSQDIRQGDEVEYGLKREGAITGISFIKKIRKADPPATPAAAQPATPPAAQPAAKPQEPCTSPEAAPVSEKDVWTAECEEFKQLLLSTGREGIQGLLDYLEKETDFLIAPSSTKYHDARDGGLLHHSLQTYHNLVTLYQTFNLDIPADSLVIIGLLHDVCKANFYKTSTRNVKKELPGGFSEWVKEPYIDIEDQFPLGHGEKSTILLQRKIQLTDTEIMAIRWHMMAYDDIRCSYAGNLAITNACSKFPIIVLTHIADLSASFLEVRVPVENPPGGA